VRALSKEADERQLIEAAQRDPAHFSELYSRNFRVVYAYILRRVDSREEAEDLTSEVFHQALANLPRFEWRGAPFAAWLLRIAANAISDRWRLRAREADDPPDENLSGPVMDDVERRTALYEMVGRLPDDQRRVIVLRFAEQKSIREIAHDMNRSEGAVKQLQFRALEKLRAVMEGAHG
jgi:RNA polymerase sigma-70 factor (ECF subfamily)